MLANTVAQWMKLTMFGALAVNGTSMPLDLAQNLSRFMYSVSGRLGIFLEGDPNH